MTIRKRIKALSPHFQKVRYLGRATRIAAAVWKAPITRSAVDELRIKLDELRHGLGVLNDARHALENRTSTLERKLQAIGEGMTASFRGVETALKRHEVGYGRVQQVVEERNADFDKRIQWLTKDNNNLRQRMEFIRTETMFELRRHMKVRSGTSSTADTDVTPRVVNREKLERPGPKALNLGCGHKPLEEYINIDSRELPGVDFVCDVTDLPFERGSIDTVFAAHLVEHFSEQTLRDSILPHWHSLLKPDGRLVLVAPDAGAMLQAYSSGEIKFDQLREVTFGGQEYEGDFHYSMFTVETLKRLLTDSGFARVDVAASGRVNGLCRELELHAFPGATSTENLVRA
jgi:predicted SAM-dependent methyltransferase